MSEEQTKENEAQDSTTNVDEVANQLDQSTAAKADKDATGQTPQAPVDPSADVNAVAGTVGEKEEEKKDERTRRFDNRRGGPGGARGRGGDRRRGGRRPQRREKPEFDQKIVSLRRVTRVMAGGRRFSFSAAVVIGDKKGKVGFGIGKANDTAAAVDKAVRQAKKNMLILKRTDNNSIPYDNTAKYKASEVMLRPVTGKGLAAGGGVRIVLEMAGLDEIGGKLLSRSKNNINNSKATLLALLPFATNKNEIKI